ncbi:MAG: hypothetical protein ACOX87_01985 [Chloroflexota bacterium]|jgi:hypothetical protein
MTEISDKIVAIPNMSVEPSVGTKQSNTHRQRSLGLLAWLLPSISDVLFLALLGFALGARSHQLFNTDGDLGRHIAVGRQILADRAIPTIDLFSHTMAGEPFVPYEWLSEVIYALTYQQLGYGGIAVLAASLAALPFLLLARWMVRDGSNIFLVIFLVTIGALAASIHWLARPHLFTILLALLWTRSLQNYRASGRLRYLVALPPMMIAWVNLHGGFLVGFVILIVFALSSAVEGLVMGAERTENNTRHSIRDTRNLAVAGAISLVAVGLNPSGFAVLPHVLSYFQYRFLVNNTMEYLSPNFHNLGPQLFACLILLSIVAMAFTSRRQSITDVALLAVWIAFSLFSARNIPLFVVICLPFIGRVASEALGNMHLLTPAWIDKKLETPQTLVGVPQTRRYLSEQRSANLLEKDGARPSLAAVLSATDQLLGRPLLPVLGIALAFWLTVGGIGANHVDVGFDERKFPIQALEQAEELGVRGNLFNYFPWGGYILYAGYPKYRVFIDGQTDFYGEELTKDYLKVARLEPEWHEVLDRYQIGWVLFPHQSPLSLMLARTPGWQLAYQDETSDLFIRN